MDLTAQRDPTVIIAEIVKACLDPRLYTHILGVVNINPKVANRYFPLCEKSGFIKYSDGKYLATPKGVEFVTKMEEIRRMIKV